MRRTIRLLIILLIVSGITVTYTPTNNEWYKTLDIRWRSTVAVQRVIVIENNLRSGQ